MKTLQTLTSGEILAGILHDTLSIVTIEEVSDDLIRLRGSEAIYSRQTGARLTSEGFAFLRPLTRKDQQQANRAIMLKEVSQVLSREQANTEDGEQRPSVLQIAEGLSIEELTKLHSLLAQLGFLY